MAPYLRGHTHLLQGSIFGRSAQRPRYISGWYRHSRLRHLQDGRAITLSQAEEVRCSGHEDESLDWLDIAQCRGRSSQWFVLTQRERLHLQAANSAHERA